MGNRQTTAKKSVPWKSEHLCQAHFPNPNRDQVEKIIAFYTIQQ